MTHRPRTDAAREPLLPWLVGEIAQRVGVPPDRIDVDADFDEFGLDSVQAVAVSGALSERLGQELPATLLYEHPSIRELAGFLDRVQEPRR